MENPSVYNRAIIPFGLIRCHSEPLLRGVESSFVDFYLSAERAYGKSIKRDPYVATSWLLWMMDSVLA